jgi:hypothetical protein
MDTQGIDRQVVGGWLDMFAYEIPVAEGERWSLLINEHLVQAARSIRGSFRCDGTITGWLAGRSGAARSA